MNSVIRYVLYQPEHDAYLSKTSRKGLKYAEIMMDLKQASLVAKSYGCKIKAVRVELVDGDIEPLDNPQDNVYDMETTNGEVVYPN